MGEVVLHGFWRSSSSHRVRIALAYKGIPAVLRSVHLGRREQLEPGFLALNPAGQLPVLEHEGLVLTQSVAILRYLDLRVVDRPARRPLDSPTSAVRVLLGEVNGMPYSASAVAKTPHAAESPLTAAVQFFTFSIKSGRLAVEIAHYL